MCSGSALRFGVPTPSRAGQQARDGVEARSQAVGVKLGEIYALMEAQRAMVYRLAWMMDNPSERDAKYSPMLNWYAAEACYRAATLAMQVMGCGGGWLSLSGQKHVRDALVYFPNGGNHSMQLLKVHRGLMAPAVRA